LILKKKLMTGISSVNMEIVMSLMSNTNQENKWIKKLSFKTGRPKFQNFQNRNQKFIKV
jgi:hypothetical protein